MFRLTVGRILLLLMVLLVSGSASAQVAWTASRHVNTAFTNNDFDNIITDANQRLKMDNARCNDVPCTASFTRSGNVAVFGLVGDGLDTVTTQAELQAVMGEANRFKVVTFLSRCAGATNPSFIGCAYCPGNDVVLESTVAAGVFIHEYGHNVEAQDCSTGGHRLGCDHNIMNPALDGTNDAVNGHECVILGGKKFVELKGDIFDGNQGPLTQHDGPYWVIGDITVPAGEHLTVEPGAQIQFKQNYRLTVEGTLSANGLQQDIQIYSNDEAMPGLDIMSNITMKGGILKLH